MTLRNSLWSQRFFCDPKEFFMTSPERFERALESSRNYLIAYAISNNSRKVFDLKETSRTLNFYPEDDSENYFMNVK